MHIEVVYTRKNRIFRDHENMLRTLYKCHTFIFPFAAAMLGDFQFLHFQVTNR